jgi:hypothetical protein
MIFDDLATKGIRIAIYPKYENKQWYWIAGIYVGDKYKGIWIDSNNGLPYAAYNSYNDAYKATIKFIKNHAKKDN